MRRLTKSEVDSIFFNKLILAFHIVDIREGKRYPYNIELRRISFECDKDFLGNYDDYNGNQTGFSIMLKTYDDRKVDDEPVYITECSERDAITILGAMQVEYMKIGLRMFWYYNIYA